MKKRIRKKIPKLRSKKGMTLVEILAGVVIIVIVFGATLSAMTNGFSSTLRNATANRDAVEGEEIVIVNKSLERLFIVPPKGVGNGKVILVYK